ncbi:M48 family metalloprotease [Nocardiopsis suaedae]|uniref:M48 family metalloprotease n=1 Tax=Nocardiopsis suaedae TaxID=3018444 RepID=A0ABT4TE90_9ACTN|nr:M48 family metalloprotease [Nocardiopsis suaedae]MDA2802946.1 M48 family metalloprotease [Nocardiopsis suaedae]
MPVNPSTLLGVRWWRGVREARRRGAGAGVVADDRPMAMAVPGRRGGVVLSRGLLRLLSREQLGVVLRHEHAHPRHRHHVYAAAGALAAALFPPPAPVHRRLRFDLERWADEEAAAAVGDRGLVARTIAQAVPAAPGPARHPGLADFQVVRRVEALLGEPPAANPVAGPALLGGTGAASGGVASTCIELHHIAFLLLL